MPDYPFAVLDHPIGSCTPDEIKQRAIVAADQAERILQGDLKSRVMKRLSRVKISRGRAGNRALYVSMRIRDYGVRKSFVTAFFRRIE